MLSLCSASDIECAADARQKAGCDVTRLCYDDSSHVDHLREHRESYITNVDAFVRRCVDARNKSDKEPAFEDESADADAE